MDKEQRICQIRTIRPSEVPISSMLPEKELSQIPIHAGIQALFNMPRMMLDRFLRELITQEFGRFKDAFDQKVEQYIKKLS